MKRLLWLNAQEQQEAVLPNNYQFLCSHVWQDECFLCFEVPVDDDAVPIYKNKTVSQCKENKE